MASVTHKVRICPIFTHTHTHIHIIFTYSQQHKVPMLGGFSSWQATERTERERKTSERVIFRGFSYATLYTDKLLYIKPCTYICISIYLCRYIEGKNLKWHKYTHTHSHSFHGFSYFLSRTLSSTPPDIYLFDEPKKNCDRDQSMNK